MKSTTMSAPMTSNRHDQEAAARTPGVTACFSLFDDSLTSKSRQTSTIGGLGT